MHNQSPATESIQISWKYNVLVGLNGSDLGFLRCISHWILPTPPVHQDEPLLERQLWLLKEAPISQALCLSTGSHRTPPPMIEVTLSLLLICTSPTKSDNYYQLELIAIYCLPSLVLYIILYLYDHCSTIDRTVWLTRQQVLLLEPSNLVVQVTKNDWPKVQDAHLLPKEHESPLDFPALAADWQIESTGCTAYSILY